MDDAWELWNKAMFLQISESVEQSDASALFLSVFEKLNVLYGKHNFSWFLSSRQCKDYLWAVESTRSFRAVLHCRYAWRGIPGICTARSCYQQWGAERTACTGCGGESVVVVTVQIGVLRSDRVMWRILYVRLHIHTVGSFTKLSAMNKILPAAGVCSIESARAIRSGCPINMKSRTTRFV